MCSFFCTDAAKSRLFPKMSGPENSFTSKSMVSAVSLARPLEEIDYPDVSVSRYVDVIDVAQARRFKETLAAQQD